MKRTRSGKPKEEEHEPKPIDVSQLRNTSLRISIKYLEAQSTAETANIADLNNKAITKLLKDKNTPLFLAHLYTALRIMPDHPTVNYNLANYYTRKNEYDQATHLWNRVIVSEKSFTKTQIANAYNNRAYCCARLNQHQLARKDLDDALEANPDHQAAKFNIALYENYTMALYKKSTGENYGAIEHLDLVMRGLKPTHPTRKDAETIKQNLERLIETKRDKILLDKHHLRRVTTHKTVQHKKSDLLERMHNPIHRRIKASCLPPLYSR